MSYVVAKDPIKETLTPDTDDVTVAFNMSQDYKPGSVSVWQNGIKKIQEWDDGYEETGPNEITMKEAPLAGDSLQAEYQPA